ncbi:MAG: hypothetical protein ACD_11C00021G0022 [uncultured bacterium]|nr:MAG: hypothetical protein ACD_11C00021G0022 [uncultured bacterium]HBR71822.1 hypothetical protein [Candidatus Moranbacteria bacterium]
MEMMQKKSEKLEKKSRHIPGMFMDVSGWKKDAKKIFYVLLILLVAGGIYQGVSKLKPYLTWGAHFKSPIELIKYQTYSSEDLDLSFSYSDKYVFDANEKKKYSKDYLAGFYLKADQRTGCDVRLTDIGINFSKNDQEIKDAISKDLAANVKGFADFSGERIEIDGESAMRVSFLLTDPLGNILRITQVMVTHNNKSYLLVCGAGQPHYAIYEKDFNDFIEKIHWKK